jgi:hypothetical protein
MAKNKNKKGKPKQNKTKTKRQGILKIEEHQPQMKSGGALGCSGKVSCSFSISGVRPSTFYLARCQALTSNSTSKEIKRTTNPTIQAHTNNSSDTRSIALISITTTSTS